MNGTSMRGLALAVVLGLSAAGCGGGASDGGDVHVSGSITFDGKPIPAGKVYFSPDNSKGNSGPSGYADIKDGKFDTSDGGRPTAGGATVVRIEGFDPNSASSEDNGEDVMKALFPTYETTAELTGSKATQDFAVPAEAANRKDKPESGTTGGP